MATRCSALEDTRAWWLGLVGGRVDEWDVSGAGHAWDGVAAV